MHGNNSIDLKEFGLYYIIFLIFLVSIFVGIRDSSIGTDYDAYFRYYMSFSSGYNVWNYEFLFHNISKVLSYLGFNYPIYLSIIYLILNFLIIIFAVKLHGEIDGRKLFLLFGFFFLSNWYIAATINGLRQGLSLPISYLAIFFFYKRKYILSVLLLIASFGFHKSAITLAPFLFIIYLSINKSFLFFIFSAFLYQIGTTEFIFSRFSQYFSSSAYADIASYGINSEFYGFNIYYFIYTLLIGIAFYIAGKFLPSHSRDKFFIVLRMYFLLSMPYFYLAHGGYSNRFAFMAWLFLPFLYSTFISCMNINNRNFSVIAVFILFIGCVKYISVLNFGIIEI